MWLLNFFKKKEKNEPEKEKEIKKIVVEQPKIEQNKYWYKYKKYNYMKTEPKKLDWNWKYKDVNIDVNNKIEVIHRLRLFNPVDFEYFVLKLFELSWFNIIRKPLHKWKDSCKDWWIDIILEKWWSKFFVQIKKTYWSQLWVDIIRQLKWILTDKDKQWWKWIIITTSMFSEDARNEWKDSLILLDYNWILQTINNFEESDRKYLEKWYLNNWDKIKHFLTDPKTCKKCWAPMQKIKVWKNSFYWCMNYFSKWKKHCENTTDYLDW